MKIFKDENRKLYFSYPDKWEIAQDESTLSIYDPVDGLGVLQISSYNVPDPKEISIKDELEEFIEERHNEITVHLTDDFAYTPYLIDENKRYWKYWLILKKNTLIFCSYNCQKEDFGKEEKTLNEIIASIVK
ncbi:MAG TPA: DUF3805 domain-containing protein [Chitinophagaceae bacterium]|jgi:hypothetical protein|nr:DUF3805 domain-containing protein [Chitinophagaceae bacterium]